MSAIPLPSDLSHYPRLLDFLGKQSPERQLQSFRILARNDLYFLLRYPLRRPDIEHPWLFDRCREVQASPNGHLDLWAREHYKSTIITFALTIQDILSSHGDDPDPKWEGIEVCFGIFSHTRPIAKGFLRPIKFEFESNETLKEWFPDVLYADPERQSPKWSEDDGIVVRRTTNRKESTVEAWGLVDSQPTGRHFPARVYDDVIDDVAVKTPGAIERVASAWELSQNLEGPPGIQRVAGTRYHFRDCYGLMIERGTVQPRVYAITKDGTVGGEPWLKTPEQVAKKRRDQGPYTFACQQLLNPSADGTQNFRLEWLAYHDGVQDWSRLHIVLLFDPANEKKKESDYTAAWAIGLGADMNYYVLDMVRDRLRLTERADLLFNWHRKYHPYVKAVAYESYGLKADVQHFQERMTRETYRFEITEVGTQLKKTDRCLRTVPEFEQGRILLPRSLHYTDYEGIVRDLVHDFVHQEYLPFPVAIHEDMLDSLSRIHDLKVPFPVTTTYERKDIPTGSWMA